MIEIRSNNYVFVYTCYIDEQCMNRKMVQDMSKLLILKCSVGDNNGFFALEKTSLQKCLAVSAAPLHSRVI